MERGARGGRGSARWRGPPPRHGHQARIYYAGKVVGEENVYSDSLLMFLLKAHRPTLYRDNVKMEHSGGMDVTGGRKVTFEFVRPAEQQARTLAELAAEEQHARTLAELTAEEAEGEAKEAP